MDILRCGYLGLPLPLKRQKLLRGATGRDEDAADMVDRYELMSDELPVTFLTPVLFVMTNIGPSFKRDIKLTFCFARHLCN